MRSVQNYESGDSEPSSRILEKICAALDTDTAYFYGSESALKEAGIDYQVIEHPEAKSIIAYMQRVIAACRGRGSRLGWVLEELKARFPLDKWKAEDDAIAGTNLTSTPSEAEKSFSLAKDHLKESAPKSGAAGPTGNKAAPDPDAAGH